MINWDLPNEHVLAVTVPAEAIDVMGHVNNTEYLRFMEKIAWDHTTVLGLGWDLYQKPQPRHGGPANRSGLPGPAFEGETLLIGTWIVDNDQRISITRRYQIIRESDGVTLLRGRTRWVCVALDSGRPKRMPCRICERLSGHRQRKKSMTILIIPKLVRKDFPWIGFRPWCLPLFRDSPSFFPYPVRHT